MTARRVTDTQRRRFSTCLGLLTLTAGLGKRAAAALAPPPWEAWRRFQGRFLGAGDRVIDPATADERTTSEGQAYALFFSLVANDPARFERILRWSEEALCQGDLILRLPAWLWGRRTDGTSGVLDDNSAADADLWIAYVLAEAGRLWGNRRYLALAAALRARILAEETASLPELGTILLPGRSGFASADQWRVNPSYAPLFVLRRCAALSPDSGWRDMANSQSRLLRRCASLGWAPDWAVLRAQNGSIVVRREADRPEDRVGSYDAIRVYLWLALDAADAPGRADLLAHFRPALTWLQTHDTPPERIDVSTATIVDAEADHAPIGFLAVMEAFCRALAAPHLAQRLHVARQRLGDDPPGYYDQALSLFASAWMDGRFALGVDGRLEVPWHTDGA